MPLFLCISEVRPFQVRVTVSITLSLKRMFKIRSGLATQSSWDFYSDIRYARKTLSSRFAPSFEGEMQVSKQHPRIAREKKTIDKMVHVYCKGNHKTKGEQLCAECTEFLSYALMRLDKCPFQEEKSTCGKCLVHCYQPQMREKAKKVMRYSGPRLLLRAPSLAFHHALDGRKKPQTIEEFRRKKAQSPA